jgi:dihydroorotase
VAKAAVPSGQAKVLGVETGRIAPGGLADLTLIDLSLKRTVDKRSFRSKGRNTPFYGWELTGWPVGTMVGGKLVISQGEVLA